MADDVLDQQLQLRAAETKQLMNLAALAVLGLVAEIIGMVLSFVDSIGE